MKKGKIFLCVCIALFSCNSDRVGVAVTHAKIGDQVVYVKDVQSGKTISVRNFYRYNGFRIEISPGDEVRYQKKFGTQSGFFNIFCAENILVGVDKEKK
ncbi:MAG: hypothetical protein RL641_189 [Candidatus Parcubacteria bacterium]|jgi:hypothetical protein